MELTFTSGETNIICLDLERSLRFHRDILGFQVIEREGPAAVHMRCDEQPFSLLAVAKSPLNEIEYCEVPTISFDLLVRDIKEAVSYFENHGVEFESP
jgi:catechol 2,3-dioxygenase-like lactoylglutathione lyase family enzyme